MNFTSVKFEYKTMIWNNGFVNILCMWIELSNTSTYNSLNSKTPQRITGIKKKK